MKTQHPGNVAPTRLGDSHWCATEAQQTSAVHLEGGISMAPTKGQRLAIITLVCVALAVPSAIGVPKQSAGKSAGAKGIAAKTASSTATPTVGVNGSGKGKGWNKQRAAQAKKRITNVLRARNSRFVAVSANLEKRIVRMEALASRAASYGVDVTVARAKLVTARAKLDEAKALEAAAVAKFALVADAADRFAAFRVAKAAGRDANTAVKATRSAIQDAGHTLRQAIIAAQAAASVESSGTVETTETADGS